MSIVQLTATELHRRFMAGELAATQIVGAYLERAAQFDPQIGALIELYEDEAVARAEQLQRRRDAGEKLGPLAAVPVTVKDVLCHRGHVTSCASKMLESFQAPYTSTALQGLLDADAIVIGRTNMDEFAMGGSTENSALQTTRNPWDVSRVPGGSSGGAAASVAADFCPLAIGSDTGGSIRQPAAYCGVSGLKPTYGRVSRYGLVAFASSLDQIGPLARTVEDLAMGLGGIAGHDARDSTSAPREVPDYGKWIAAPSTGDSLSGLRIGLLEEQLADVAGEISAAVVSAAESLASLGAVIEPVSLPHAKYGVATYYLIAPSEASSNLARYDGVRYGLRVEQDKVRDGEDDEGALVGMYRATRSEGFGPEVKRRIMLGTYALSAGYYDAYYLKALKVRRLIQRDYLSAFEQVDLLLGPTTPSAAFAVGQLVDDPLELYLQDLFTVTANLAGVPALSVPGGMTEDGLPIGVQLQGRPFEEARLLQAGHQFQLVTDWHAKRPRLA